jgi:hypothetical protein
MLTKASDDANVIGIKRDKGYLKKRVGYVLFPLVLFWFGYSGAFQSIAKTGTLFFKYYTEAELRKLEASGLINSDGEAEYVIGLETGPESGIAVGMGKLFLESMEGLSDVRETAFDEWFVVTVNSNTRDNIKKIRNLSETRFVLQNRGVWLCH